MDNAENATFAAELSDVEIAWNEQTGPNAAFIDITVNDDARPWGIPTMVTVVGLNLDDARSLLAMLEAEIKRAEEANGK